MYDSFERHKIAGWVRDRAMELLDPLPDSIAIFGSFARNDFRKDSDIDLLLVGDRIPRKPYDRARWVHPLLNRWRKERPSFEARIPSAISPLILTQEGWKNSIGLRLSLADHVWMLYDDGFVSETLKEAREWLQKGLWERKTSKDGGWLWIPREAASRV